MTPSASMTVVVSTYEWPGALAVVLRALWEQRDPSFDVVVADDGSGDETRNVVSRWQAVFGDRLTHSRQPDEGWRKARALDGAALEARGRYLVFLDGDCVPRRGFTRALRRAALPGWFLASKRVNLSEGLSQRVIAGQLPVWRWSAARWLAGSARELLTAHREAARPGLLLPVRDRRRPWREGQPEFVPPFDGYGFVLGVERDEFERVNGFDTRFTGWGGEDEDIAARLRHAGLRCGWPGPGATVLHLWHPVHKGTSPSNAPFVAETKASGRVAAVSGLRELAAERMSTVSP
jgi:GT2 family glycosyltransferase